MQSQASNLKPSSSLLHNSPISHGLNTFCFKISASLFSLLSLTRDVTVSCCVAHHSLVLLQLLVLFLSCIALCCIALAASLKELPLSLEPPAVSCQPSRTNTYSLVPRLNYPDIHQPRVRLKPSDLAKRFVTHGHLKRLQERISLARYPPHPSYWSCP